MDYIDKIQESIEYIENNLSEKILLEDIAKAAYLSKYYYHRVFHDIAGEPVMEYVRKRRLTEAAKDLLEGKEKIVDIALKYQFSSQEAFSRAFKKMYGVSPNKIRKTQQRVLLYKKLEIARITKVTSSALSVTCKAA
ncbi:helix-turn-helix transcriptional regulator [Clostridium sp. YIM B02505]|uniref:Helix-turn-helix transcriptional regulator n=1 Tax=Clostridium yunnanense TaxID=2800325 RepID=A0ABS1EL21_9CLOT|nr:AraC family transcriptional regulator [Clostridium yunnanense]MBK1810048.1 helix-turn-helix transcriptional regulator [Clostridium yunnanense]